jgi:LacI family transcriptional regulator
MPSTSEPTIHDVARRLNVSATTVWRAINDRPRVSTQTRARVKAEVKRMGYRPSLVVPTIGNSVHAALVRAAEQAAFGRDYSIVLCDTDFNLDREHQHLDLLIRRRVDGVLLVPFAKSEASSHSHLELLKQAGVTVVCMQQRLPDAAVPQVVPDNFGAAAAMTRHLISLGHRRIAFLHAGLPPWYVSMNERLAGYRAALEEADLTVESDLIVEVGSFESQLSDDEGTFYADRVTALLERPNRPTAVFAPVDVLAIKTMAAIRRLGLRIPEDVAVAGFDNRQMSGFTDPPLTTVRHPAAEVGRRAANLLFEQISGSEGTNESPIFEQVPCELVIRKSCGASDH